MYWKFGEILSLKFFLDYLHSRFEVWPERTDPAKFVYEDVAIASYLLLIWRQERALTGSVALQSFADLGCGNGLLVYILAMEGHKGFGIDLRKRTIWDTYPKDVIDLRVESIVPSDENLYPATDWILGNHSDELSPWVPVIAARSSQQCRYFLLPCCAFDFDGKKFQRRNSSISQYEDFMAYAQQISSACGYDTQMDRLKIPSTKRICLIGYDRSRREGVDFRKYGEDITAFIKRAFESGGDQKNEGEDNQWSADFKPRNAVETVKNCTKLKRSVVVEIVDLVFREILRGECYDDSVFGGTWNVGTGVLLRELAGMLPLDKMKELKSECGGLQTLLRNHNQIFEVRGGEVRLRLPLTIEEKKIQLEKQKEVKKGGRGGTGKTFHFQQTPCFFLAHHPNGCPLTVDTCSFKHDKDAMN